MKYEFSWKESSIAVDVSESTTGRKRTYRRISKRDKMTCLEACFEKLYRFRGGIDAEFLASPKDTLIVDFPGSRERVYMTCKDDAGTIELTTFLYKTETMMNTSADAAETAIEKGGITIDFFRNKEAKSRPYFEFTRECTFSEYAG